MANTADILNKMGVFDASNAAEAATPVLPPDANDFPEKKRQLVPSSPDLADVLKNCLNSYNQKDYSPK